MGGDSQPQILLQLLARLCHSGQGPGEALAAGRWALASGSSGFATWTALSGDQVLVEGHAAAGWDAGLAARGHDVRRTDAFSHQYGHAQAILVEDDRLAGASDPRPRSGERQRVLTRTEPCPNRR